MLVLALHPLTLTTIMEELPGPEGAGQSDQKIGEDRSLSCMVLRYLRIYNSFFMYLFLYK